MFNTIAWATDGSEAADSALPAVRHLAKQGNAKVVVIHVAEVALSRAGRVPAHADEPSLEQKVRDQAKQLNDEGIPTTVDLSTGLEIPAHAIAERAKELGADLIVVGTRGHGPVAGLLLGSVTQRLLHIAHCPVLAVPPGAGA
jgi:nucleotide-binding universal stress UspA family protein